MKMMQYSMPLLSVYISFQMAAAIGLYWIYRNILATVQTVLLYKLIPVPKYTEEDYKAAERELKGKGGHKNNTSAQSGEKKQNVRSLHRIDEEDDDVVTEVKKNVQSKTPELREGADERKAPKLKDESDRNVKTSDENGDNE